MKLAKKMLAGVMALAMIAALALTAFAAAPVVVATTEEYASVGDTVTVAISANGITGLMSGSLVVSFDATALKVANTTDGVEITAPSDAAYNMGMGGNTSEGVVTWSFMWMGASEVDSTSVLTIEFEVLAEGDHTVSIVAEDWDGADLPAEVSVVISEKETTTAAPTTEAPVTTTAAPTTAAPTEATSEAPTTDEIPVTGEAGVAAIAGVMALAAVAFVATRKKDEE